MRRFAEYAFAVAVLCVGLLGFGAFLDTLWRILGWPGIVGYFAYIGLIALAVSL